MADYPALPLWTDAYLADAGHLTDSEHGVYLQLLLHAWRAPGCRLPNDDKWLARRFHRSVEEVQQTVRPLIEEFFKTDGNWLTQKRLSREYEFVKRTSKKQSDRAKSRWKKNKIPCPSNAQAMPEPCSPAYAGAMQPCNAPTPTPTPLESERKEEEKKEDSARIEEIQADGGGGPKLPDCVSAPNEGDRDASLETELNLPAHLDRNSPACVIRLSDFERWWRHWAIGGTKRGKVAAEKIFNAVLRKSDGPSVADLIDGLDRYIAHCQAEKTDVSKIIHPERWLSKGRWADEYAAPRRTEGAVLQKIYDQGQRKERQDGDVC